MSSSSSAAPHLEIRDNYTDRSFVVFGHGGGEQTQQFMHLLKNADGKSNFGHFTYKNDTDGNPIKKPGYVYSTKLHRERIGKIVKEINEDKHKPVAYEKKSYEKKTESSSSSSSSADSKNYVSKELFMQLVNRVQVLEQEVSLLRSAILNPDVKMPSSGKNEEDVQDDTDDDEETVVDSRARRCPLWGPNRKGSAK